MFRAALANQRHYVSDTHYDVRRIFGMMAERYQRAGNRAKKGRYARMALLG
ncbi:MAG: hypothetical protein ABJE47_19685 [bacterium]